LSGKTAHDDLVCPPSVSACDHPVTTTAKFSTSLCSDGTTRPQKLMRKLLKKQGFAPPDALRRRGLVAGPHAHDGREHGDNIRVRLGSEYSIRTLQNADEKHGASTDLFNRCTWYLIPSNFVDECDLSATTAGVKSDRRNRKPLNKR
jgi:hypothetical protein